MHFASHLRTLLVVDVLVWVAAGATTPSTAGEPPPFVQVPNPVAEDNPAYPVKVQPVPEAGKAFQDACFATSLVRATGAEGIRNEYSRFDPFNQDGTMVMLVQPASGDRRIYRTASLPYDAKENLVRDLDIEEPRWDPEDPNLLWGTRDFQIVTGNAKTGDAKTVKDFAKDPKIEPILKAEPDLYRITMKDEGETSRDKRYWALFIQGKDDDYRSRYILTWDREGDRILGLLKLAKDESDIDWVGMSPLGKWAIIGAMDSNGGKIVGLTMANRELTEFHRLDFSTAHADVGLDAAGNEVVVMQNVRTDHIDLIPIDARTKPILEAGGSYDGTNRTPLVRLFYNSESPKGFNCGIHISCNAAGYAVVSTHVDPQAKEQNWLDRSILLVRLDPKAPKAWYLAKVHSICGAYWEETQATISADGSRVVWASNWGQDVGKEKSFLIQLNMPKGWQERLK